MQPYGKTVDAVITEASAAQTAAAQAAASQHALEYDVTIAPAEFHVERGANVFGGTSYDASYKDVDHLVFRVTNHGAKTIASFQADANLTNQGGEEIFKGQLAASEPIAPAPRFRFASIIHRTSFKLTAPATPQ